MLSRLNWQSHPQAKAAPARRSYLPALIALSILYVLWLGYRFVLQPEWEANLPGFAAELLRLIDAAWGVTLLILWGIVLWRKRRQPSKPKALLDIDELYALSPGDFEAYVGHLFRMKGYDVKLRGSSGDQGVDIEIMQPGGRRAIVQCKRYRHTVGPEIVRELFGAMIHEHVHHAFLVTTADISDSAYEWARFKPITLINGDSLVQAASELYAAQSTV